MNENFNKVQQCPVKNASIYGLNQTTIIAIDKTLPTATIAFEYSNYKKRWFKTKLFNNIKCKKIINVIQIHNYEAVILNNGMIQILNSQGSIRLVIFPTKPKNVITAIVCGNNIHMFEVEEPEKKSTMYPDLKILSHNIVYVTPISNNTKLNNKNKNSTHIDETKSSFKIKYKKIAKVTALLSNVTNVTAINILKNKIS